MTWDQRLKQIFPIIRDVLLFLGGMGLAYHETLSTTFERPSILILAATMMGLPFVIRKDSNGNGNGDNSGGK